MPNVFSENVPAVRVLNARPKHFLDTGFALLQRRASQFGQNKSTSSANISGSVTREGRQGHGHARSVAHQKALKDYRNEESDCPDRAATAIL
jgi:hypothetical protein